MPVFDNGMFHISEKPSSSVSMLCVDVVCFVSASDSHMAIRTTLKVIVRECGVWIIEDVYSLLLIVDFAMI
jgi:hypothetical protein